MSLIRTFGIAFALLLLVVVYFRLRYHANRRADVWLMSITAFALLVVSLSPNVLSLPSEIFSLANVRGGRIISLLMIVSFVMWMLLTSVRARLSVSEERIQRFVRQSAIDDFELRRPPPTLPQGKWCAVIIPVYNEAANLPPVLGKVPQTACGLDLQTLVIDDGSSDGGDDLARRFGALVVKHPINIGGGAALSTGQAVALRLGANYAVTMDGDGQHNPAEIEALLAPVAADHADIVVGSRRLGSTEHYSWLREAGVKLFSALINALLGTKISDCASGFRALNLDKLRGIPMRQSQYHTAELLIQASKRGLRIDERPIHIARRLSGDSKKGANFTYAFSFLKTVVYTWLR